MSLFGAMAVSASALAAERLRMELVAENLANVHTTRTPAGGPYRRKIVAFAQEGSGFAPLLARRLAAGRDEPAGRVRAVGIYEDPAPFKRIYDPSHPDAGPDGYVLLPNVDVTEEMVNLIAAVRAYEANVTAFNVGKTLVQTALQIGQ
ncbi:MAG TPA: flagellar basal body rod protein FlgC [Bacillota bacterium]